jgi:cytochrome c-type biogenesis protein CcmH
MPFWIAAGLLVAGSLILILLPLLRGRGRASRRASYDMQIYRDQLEEVEVELARGILSPEEAEATRIEVSRRLLAAADAEASETGSQTAPRGISLAAGLALAVLAGSAALVIYATMGVPGLPDQPFALREQRMAEARASRPGQDKAEAAVLAEAERVPDLRPQLSERDASLIGRLREVLKDRPEDLEGHRLLARSLAAMGQFPEARAAQEDVVAMLGDSVTAGDEIELAEAMILAAGGYVSPQAEQVLVRALEREPQNRLGRYYSGITLLQAGRPDLAYPLWTRLLEEGPPDAPWVAPIRAQIADVARMAGMPPPDAAEPAESPASGPSQADIAAAGTMSPEDRQAMIVNMVDGLGARLAAEGGPPADWAQLIRALGVLGREDEAREILTEARAKFEGDPAALSRFEAAAQAGGLAP